MARLDHLEDSCNLILAEQLGCDFQKAAAQSTAKCKRKRNVAYMEILTTAQKEKNVLRRILSQQNTRIDYTTSIAHLTRDSSSFLIPANPVECQKCCKNLQKLICQYEKSAAMLCQEELYQCLQTAKLLGDTATITHIWTILSVENRRSTFKKLWNIQAPSSSGMNKVLIPQTANPSSSTSNVNWISLETPHETEEALQIHNLTHFGQAHGSFPTNPPFSR